MDGSGLDGSSGSASLQAGECYPDLSRMAASSRPFDIDPWPVPQARQSGSGNRLPPRLAPDGTAWCLTCNTVLGSPSKTFCSQCQRGYDAQRGRERRAARQNAEPTFTLWQEHAHAIHDATDSVSDVAWDLRVALDAKVPPQQKMAEVERLADELVVALKDLVWYVEAHLPDHRPADERNTEWRRRLPMPRQEPEPTGGALAAAAPA